MNAKQWNENYPIGTLVKYEPIKGEGYEPPVSTRSEAWELGHGQPIVKIEGRAGGVCLDHLIVIAP